MTAPGTATPRVSAVMTVYNQEDYLADAIDSVLRQSFSDHELIVVDDGSRDRSAEIARSFGERIVFVQRENGGLGAARNTGIEVARGEYVAFCDADDIHLPHRFAAHAALLDQSPDAACVFSEFSTLQGMEIQKEYSLRGRWLGPALRPFDQEIEAAFGTWKSARDREVPVPERYGDRRVYQGHVAPLIATVHVAWGGVSMFRRAALRAIGGHDPKLRRYTDWYVVSRLAKSYELIFLDVPVIHYRLHGAQLTKKPKLGALCYLDVIERVWKGDPVFYAQHKEIVDRALSAAHLQLASIFRREGDLETAERQYLESLRLNPRQRRPYLELVETVARRRFGRA